MEVIEILGEKGNEVVTATTDTVIGDIVQQLAGKKIGVMVVVDGAGKPTGVISERDILRDLADRGPDVLGLAVAELMTSPVETCAMNENVEELMVKMVFGHIRHLPVIDGVGDMVGIVSIGDVVKGGLRELKMTKDIIQGYIIQPMASQDEATG